MLTVEPLSHRRELMPLVGDWLRSEWPNWYGTDGPGDLARDVEGFAADPTALPVGLVAFRDGVPVGFGALKQESIASHQHLSPWAAAGFVLPAHRRHGIGAALLRALVRHGADLGFGRIYCATATAASLLERSGWQLQEEIVHASAPLRIYCRST